MGFPLLRSLGSFPLFPRLAAAAALLLAAGPAPAWAVPITIQSVDDPGKGFHDPSPRQPVGGNPGTTLGAQRLFLFQYAADLWAERLQGSVPIVVAAGFENLGGDAFGAILGSAGPTSAHHDFVGAPAASTWYVGPLANQLFGADLNDMEAPGTPEIEATFNADVDGPVVLGDVDFYYGVDGKGGGDIDFLSVVLHEIGHGLGFLDLLDPSTGARFLGLDDAYLRWLEDATINPKSLRLMTDAQRKAAIVDDGDLVWVGPSVKAAATGLGAGRRGDGAVKIYAPAVYQDGSSTAHFDVSLKPDELMEPFATGVNHDLDLTTALFEDLGWKLVETVACGNGRRDQGEACDDGDVSPCGTCAADCSGAGIGAAKCGDGILCDGAWGETCDDANVVDTDACRATCVVAICGDGVVRTGVEQCDDGDQDPLDACLPNCTLATCGDGFVRTGVEQCDDGNTVDTDGCRADCVPAACGDGVVQAGVEGCDDGNDDAGDGCSPGCRVERRCGDAVHDGRLSAGDALRTLRRSVGQDVECPDHVCDVNDDGRVGAGDALAVLRAAVGLPVPLVCGQPEALVLWLDASAALGALQVDVDYAGAAVTLRGDGEDVECVSTVSGATALFHDRPGDVLSYGVVRVEGFSGPRSLFRCAWDLGGEVAASDFQVTVVDARSPSTSHVAGVSVRAVPW